MRRRRTALTATRIGANVLGVAIAGNLVKARIARANEPVGNSDSHRCFSGRSRLTAIPHPNRGARDPLTMMLPPAADEIQRSRRARPTTASPCQNTSRRVRDANARRVHGGSASRSSSGRGPHGARRDVPSSPVEQAATGAALHPEATVGVRASAPLVASRNKRDADPRHASSAREGEVISGPERVRRATPSGHFGSRPVPTKRRSISRDASSPTPVTLGAAASSGSEGSRGQPTLRGCV